MGRNFLDYFVNHEQSARIMGGAVHGSGADRYISAPALGHGRDDRSLAFKVGRQHPDGLWLNFFRKVEIHSKTGIIF